MKQISASYQRMIHNENNQVITICCEWPGEIMPDIQQLEDATFRKYDSKRRLFRRPNVRYW